MIPLYLIYLSSTTYHWWNIKDHCWKKKFINKIQKYNKNNRFIRFIDPLKIITNEPEICQIDIKDINRSNFVVIYINKLSIGTLLELGYCIFKNKDFCVVTRKKYVLNHPWIKCLCKDNIYTDINKVVELISRKYSKFLNKNFYNKKFYHGSKKTNKTTKFTKRF